jgi:hypothetical protein
MINMKLVKCVQKEIGQRIEYRNNTIVGLCIYFFSFLVNEKIISPVSTLNRVNSTQKKEKKKKNLTQVTS